MNLLIFEVYFTTFTWSYLLTRAKDGNIIDLWKPACVVDSLDLTSAPNNLGTQFVAPIKVTSTGKVLTAGADGNVTVQTWTGADNQRWIFTKNSSDNYYEIRNGQYYQKVLDVSNGSDKDGANLQIWEDNDTASQRFGIFGSQGNYVIKVKYSSGRVIDSDGSDNNVHMWTYYPDLTAQKFTVSPEPTTRFDSFSATKITNNDSKDRNLSVFGFVEFTNEDNYEQDQVNLQYTLFITKTYFNKNRIYQTINENIKSNVDGNQNATRFFGIAGAEVASYCGDKECFLGRYHPEGRRALRVEH